MAFLNDLSFYYSTIFYFFYQIKVEYGRKKQEHGSSVTVFLVEE